MGNTSGKSLLTVYSHHSETKTQMLKANKGWRAEDIKEMYKGCLPFSYMTKACNHRGSNMTDSNLPECTYEFNSCKSENQDSGSSNRRKRSTEEPAECLTEASGKDYRGSVSVTATGKTTPNILIMPRKCFFAFEAFKCQKHVVLGDIFPLSQ